ncbi:hypothetical protein HanPSC8_Chr11g0492671 [Helianthus annuus]|nr:hypothetical protein HanPSC8_Chr11g0492671 [Helianthus annuus]
MFLGRFCAHFRSKSAGSKHFSNIQAVHHIFINQIQTSFTNNPKSCLKLLPIFRARS